MSCFKHIIFFLSIALTVATAGTGATLAESHLGLASGTALNRGVGSALDGLIAHSGVCLSEVVKKNLESFPKIFKKQDKK